MTSSYDVSGTTDDDWFDLDKYKQAAQVAYDFSIGKMGKEGEEQRKGIETTGQEARATESNRAAEERATIGKTGTEQRATLGKQGEEERLSLGKQGFEQRETIGKSAEEQRARDRLLQQFKDREEERDRGQALKGYRF
jgi:hypothetical protein